MTKHHAPQHFDAPPSAPLCASACMPAFFGRRSKTVEDSLVKLDRPSSEMDVFSERALRDANEMMQSLADAGSFAEAQSAAGALFQVIVAYDYAVIAEGRTARQRKQAVAMCLWSIRHFLEQHFGIDGRDLAGESWMPKRLHPLAHLEAAAANTSRHASHDI